MGTLSRKDNLDRLNAEESWDILVIGGGATGLGTAVDAASRGYRTLLLEACDFAHGTSSRSTKLIHGGVRYLARGNIPLVREALHERGVLLRNAPHLVHSMEFLVPAYRYWQLPYYATGLWLYDRLAGGLGLGRSRWVSRDDAAERVPTIRSTGLKGGIVYADGQFDDSRLAISLALTLADLGGSALNHMAVIGLVKQDGRIRGVRARDEETGREYPVSSRVVVNATGAFTDEVRRLDVPESSAMLSPSQGAHVVLHRSFLPGRTAIMIPKTDDGRVLFAIPWSGRVLVGTTDTPVNDIPREPRPLDEEIGYLLDHAGRYLEKAPVASDIRSTFAGLRPLLKPQDRSRGSTASLSREHAVIVSDSGLVTITGGKWTTYRRMGKDAVDRAARVGGLPSRNCKTASLRLHGWSDANRDGDPHFLAYGTERSELMELVSSSPDWSRPLHPALPYLAGEVVWAVRREAARTVEDVLARRLRALFLDARASLESAPHVAAILSRELGHGPGWESDQTRQFRALAEGYLVGSRGTGISPG
jgi:glycerol-3-phosphate dehydrogenase